MRVLFIGDVVGPAGCKAVSTYLPALKSLFKIDFAIVNGENAAFHGMSRAIIDEFFHVGVNGITSGNHMWDCKEIYDFIDTEKRIIRPMNWVAIKPGRGHMVLESNGYKIMVMNALGRLFMGDEVHDPFRQVDTVLEKFELGGNVNGIVLDFHTETSAEKQAMGAYMDGRVSLVVGTHTHVPTADYQVLPHGTAYITDIGMTCDYDSNIGVRKHMMMERFLGTREKDFQFECADGPATLCAVMVDINPETGLAEAIEPVRIGGRLHQTHDIGAVA